MNKQGARRTLLVSDMETASKTTVPMYTSRPAKKKDHLGNGPFVSAKAPTPDVTMDATCIRAGFAPKFQKGKYDMKRSGIQNTNMYLRLVSGLQDILPERL